MMMKLLSNKQICSTRQPEDDINVLHQTSSQAKSDQTHLISSKCTRTINNSRLSIDIPAQNRQENSRSSSIQNTRLASTLHHVIDRLQDSRSITERTQVYTQMEGEVPSRRGTHTTTSHAKTTRRGKETKSTGEAISLYANESPHCPD